MTIRSRRVAGILGLITLITAGAILTQLPALAAGGLLHPFRRRAGSPAPDGCEDVSFQGAGVTLQGWRCQARQDRRGTLVYLHGVADNRGSGAGIVQRFVDRGFDVVAYDSRAHGDSGGDACTYGYFEKADLSRVLNTVPPGPIVLVGTSLGAAVALQEAADDPRVSAIVAAETFSDLQTIARQRAPFFLTEETIRKAFSLAEAQGEFEMAAVSPVAAAKQITAPVLIVHGALDNDTPPEHSVRVFGALRGPKRLILVPNARHNESLSGDDVWREIETWIDNVISSLAGRGAAGVRRADDRVDRLLASEGQSKGVEIERTQGLAVELQLPSRSILLHGLSPFQQWGNCPHS